MSKFIMMIGLPCSGKTSEAHNIALKENAIVLSSDDLREELFGDRRCQDNPGKVFDELYKRAKESLKNGVSVVIDATNINSKKRINTLKQFSKYEKICVYMDKPYEQCVAHDLDRYVYNASVGEPVIKRMYKFLHIPTYTEGWDFIRLVHWVPDWKFTCNTDDKYDEWDKRFNFYESWIKCHPNYDDLFDVLNHFPEFKAIYDLPQDNPHHTLSVSRHTYHVYDYLRNSGFAGPLMLWVALFHDVGKAYTKEFQDGSRYARFIGHENVSTQIAINVLHYIGYDDGEILTVAELVQLHMKLLHTNGEQRLEDNLRATVGESTFSRLKLLREADEAAR